MVRICHYNNRSKPGETLRTFPLQNIVENDSHNRKFENQLLSDVFLTQVEWKFDHTVDAFSNFAIYPISIVKTCISCTEVDFHAYRRVICYSCEFLKRVNVAQCYTLSSGCLFFLFTF